MKQTAFIFCLLLTRCVCFSQPFSHPYSSESEIGFSPCSDTIRFLNIHRPYEIGMILPSWKPIIHENFVAVLEGVVESSPKDGRDGPHVSHEDLPFYHYSHDMDFDLIPDKTEDNRFTNYLPYQIYKNGEHSDTVLARTIGIEWECGLAQNNLVNPARKANNHGESFGFFSEGHSVGETIWNWPTVNDWLHVEGHYVWDRGHPPARAEIHPPRFVAIRRNLPDKIFLKDQPERFSCRIDIFASGDGGALKNNRTDVPKFVQRTKMSSKDYTFTAQMNLVKPSKSAQLNYVVIKRKGDSFSADETIVLNSETGTVEITVPWKSSSANDIEVYARTIFLFWNEGNGTQVENEIEEYSVYLKKLFFNKKGDIDTRSENRMFVNVGNDWYFLNDFYGKRGKILSKGFGSTYSKKWDLDNKMTVYVPRDKTFRVAMNGWEADGVDYLMGDLSNQNAVCDKHTKQIIKLKLFSIQHMLFSGCMDDEYGQISQLHSPVSLSDRNFFQNAPKDGINDDPCPFSKWPLKNSYFLVYEILKCGGK